MRDLFKLFFGDGNYNDVDITNKMDPCWWMNDIERCNHEALFARLRRFPISSMARLGLLKNLKLGKLNTYTVNDKHAGDVEVPLEFSELKKALPDAYLMYNGEVGSDNRDVQGAFQIKVLRKDLGITFTLVWGTNSGVMSLWINKSRLIKCNVPTGFNLTHSIKLFQSDVKEITRFVLENGILDGSMRDSIKASGL